MLNPLETWAIDLHYRRQDEGLAIIHEAMRKLLPGMTFKGIDRERRDLMFETVDGVVPLTYLSDGYQNMAAWCGDLLFRVTDTFDDYKDPLAARGVLLVDEIDLHLHPVWQRQLRNFLSDMFPNFQFILTTHSPLTAQQAGAGELFLVKRPTPSDAPLLEPVGIEPRTMLVHQLLMSPVFGIGTPDSVAVETMKNDYETVEGHREPDRRRAVTVRGAGRRASRLARLERRPRAGRAARLAARRYQGSARETAMTRIERLRTAAAIPPAFRATGRVAKSLELIQAACRGHARVQLERLESRQAATQARDGGKCAYCESPTDTVAHGDVEHYRPKSKYWWLAYCYDNYLYACQICNQVHKGDEFPVYATDRHVDRTRAADAADACRAAALAES